MAIKVKGLKKMQKFFDQIPTFVSKHIVNKQLMQEIGDEAADIIRDRTRKGKGVDKPEGRIVPLAKLASGKRATLTDTGQMLDSLKGKAVSNNEAIVTINDTRKQERKRKKKLGNIELASYHQDGTDNMPARPFLNLAKSEANKLAKSLDEEIQERAERNLKVK